MENLETLKLILSDEKSIEYLDYGVNFIYEHSCIFPTISGKRLTELFLEEITKKWNQDANSK